MIMALSMLALPAFAEEGVTEAPVVEDPVVEEPVYEDPTVEEPVYETPVAEGPVYEEPVYETPVAEEPVYEEPVIEVPVIEVPVIEEPVVEQPVEQPAIDVPAVVVVPHIAYQYVELPAGAELFEADDLRTLYGTLEQNAIVYIKDGKIINYEDPALDILTALIAVNGEAKEVYVSAQYARALSLEEVDAYEQNIVYLQYIAAEGRFLLNAAVALAKLPVAEVPAAEQPAAQPAAETPAEQPAASEEAAPVYREAAPVALTGMTISSNTTVGQYSTTSNWPVDMSANQQYHMNDGSITLTVSATNAVGYGFHLYDPYGVGDRIDYVAFTTDNTWNIPIPSAGTYFVYIIATDGTNYSTSYAWFVAMDPPKPLSIDSMTISSNTTVGTYSNTSNWPIDMSANQQYHVNDGSIKLTVNGNNALGYGFHLYDYEAGERVNYLDFTMDNSWVIPIPKNGTYFVYIIATDGENYATTYAWFVVIPGVQVGDTFTEGDFTYKVTAEGKVEVVKYNADAASVTVPETVKGCTVTSIGESAFEGKVLSSVDLPDSVEVIGKRAFANCSNLANMN